jgi:hypothetical protein
MGSVSLFHIFLLLGAAALLLPRGKPGTFALEGLLAYAFGAASMQLGARATGSLTLAAAAALDAPKSFLTISLGLLLLGPLLGAVGAGLAWRGIPDSAGRLRVATAMGVSAGVLVAILGVVFSSGTPGALLAPVVLAAGAHAGYRLGRALSVGTVVRYADLHLFARWRWADRVRAPGGSDAVWLVILGMGIVAIAATDNVGWIIVGALAVAGSAHALAIKLWNGPRVPVLPLLVAGLIPFGIELYQLAAIGEWSMAYPGLAPLPARIEIGLLPLVALAAWGLAALWPVHGLVPNGVLAPLGGLLLFRLGAELLPAGLLYWQPLLSPLALASVWWGALTGRRTLLLSGWAFQALVSDLPMASEAAFGLLGISAALAVLPAIPERWTAGMMRILVGLSVVGIALSLPAMLQTQLVYSVLAVAAVAVAIWRKRDS